MTLYTIIPTISTKNSAYCLINLSFLCWMQLHQWNNCQKSYTHSMNRRKKEKLGSATSGMKPYIFFAQLNVFQLVTSNIETSNNFQGSKSGEGECTTNPVEARQQAYVSLQKRQQSRLLPEQ